MMVWLTERKAMFSLTTVYLVGVLGFVWFSDVFQKLTVVNILYSLLLVLLFHKSFGKGFITFMMLVGITGFVVEWLGVKTGAVFGQYAYGSTLGWKLFDIPLLIALNWVLLVYCTGTISGCVKVPWWLQAMIGAGLMVIMDILIEPFAIRYDLWAWENNVIPVQNYLAWFVVSWALLLPFHYYRFGERNKVATFLYLIQLLFFGVLLLLAKTNIIT